MDLLRRIVAWIDSEFDVQDIPTQSFSRSKSFRATGPRSSPIEKNAVLTRKVSDEEPSVPSQWPSAFYALVGFACGDALGAPFEGKNTSRINNMWPGREYPQNQIPQGAIWTDDTQMSLSIIDSIINKKCIDANYIKELWVELSEQMWFEDKGEKLKKFQFGGFRGTGQNFRNTVDSLRHSKKFDLDVSQNTAGNGAAMRIVPVAIYVYRENDEKKRITLLMDEVYKTCTITHNSALGIVPAFAFAYLLTEYINPSPTLKKLFEYSIKRQLEFLYEITCDFELYLHKKKGKIANLHSYSGLLKRLSNLKVLENPNIHSEDKFNYVAYYIFDAAKKYSSHPIQSINDGFAVASVTSAILAGMMFNDYPLLGVLQYMFRFGGDTDTVGAMVGALWGAKQGNSKGKVSRFILNQLICHQEISKVFSDFVEMVISLSNNHIFQCTFSFVKLEKRVTREILNTPNGFRNKHYNSQNSSSQPYFTKNDFYSSGFSSKNSFGGGKEKLIEQIRDFLFKEVFISEKLSPEMMVGSVENYYVRAYLCKDIMSIAINLTEEERINTFIEVWTSFQKK